MSYVNRILAQTETVRRRGALHWVLRIRPITAPIKPGVFVIGIIIFVRDFIFLTTTEVAVTERRLIRKTGLVGRHASDLVLESIEAVKLDQSLFGRLPNFGRVQVHGTDDEVRKMPLMGDPVGIRRAITETRAISSRGRDGRAA